MSIFKSCDIRGVYDSELDEETAYRLGRAVGSRMRGQRIVVAGDLRLSTPSLKAALTDGLYVSGAQIIDLGVIPTPGFYFGKRELEAPAGIMVTASHNPAEYNGFKLMLGDLPVEPQDLQALAGEMGRGEFVDQRGAYRQEPILEEYVERLIRAFPDLQAHHVVVDAGNGSMGPIAPRVLRRAGQKVTELYCEPDGSFPHRDPNPAIPEHLHDLAQRVLTTGAELGIAYDGDGDRVIFVDESGEIQPAERVLVLFIRYLLRRHPGAAVVYDLKSSSVVEEETKAAGGRPLMEKSGHAFIKRRLIEEGALLGGEVSGHYFFAQTRGDDALYATLLLLKVLDSWEIPLSQALASVPTYPITPDMRLPCPPERARRIIEQLKAAFSEYPVSTLDGVRIQFPQGWALARVSVTEPVITLRFEAHSEKELAAIQQRVRRASPLLKEIAPEAEY
jgi:phosphomannomutase/phosphoglucomutase